MTGTRKIVKIDEEKCDGCGECVIACAEGAIEIVDGKARLVSETYCDGLGACLGTCPRGAITIEEREAREFDEEATAKHLSEKAGTPAVGPSGHVSEIAKQVCPGARAIAIDRRDHVPDSAAGPIDSQLAQWPIKIILAPITASHYDGATLLIAADCAPFAYGDFHRKFLKGQPLLSGCPKFGDNDAQREKLAEILKRNDVKAMEVVHMEVPCCFGLVRLVQQAVGDAGKDIPVTLTKISISGDVLESAECPATMRSRIKFLKVPGRTRRDRIP